MVDQHHAPAGQDDRLCPAAGLTRDAGDVREVRAPLAAVQAVAPEFANLHALRRAAYVQVSPEEVIDKYRLMVQDGR